MRLRLETGIRLGRLGRHESSMALELCGWGWGGSQPLGILQKHGLEKGLEEGLTFPILTSNCDAAQA